MLFEITAYLFRMRTLYCMKIFIVGSPSSRYMYKNIGKPVHPPTHLHQIDSDMEGYPLKGIDMEGSSHEG